jgi:hypothetical protein
MLLKNAYADDLTGNGDINQYLLVTPGSVLQAYHPLKSFILLDLVAVKRKMKNVRLVDMFLKEANGMRLSRLNI